MALSARGILANIYQIPPLIFRFQFNPVLLQEKKRFKWQQSNVTGQWDFDQRSPGRHDCDQRDRRSVHG